MFFYNLEKLILDAENGLMEDEWYLSNFIEQNINHLGSEQAFEKMKGLVELMVNKNQPNYDLVDILYALKLQSNTNQEFCTEREKSYILEIYQDDYSQDILMQIFM